MGIICWVSAIKSYVSFFFPSKFAVFENLKWQTIMHWHIFVKRLCTENIKAFPESCATLIVWCSVLSNFFLLFSSKFETVNYFAQIFIKRDIEKKNKTNTFIKWKNKTKQNKTTKQNIVFKKKKKKIFVALSFSWCAKKVICITCYFHGSPLKWRKCSCNIGIEHEVISAYQDEIF